MIKREKKDNNIQSRTKLLSFLILGKLVLRKSINTNQRSDFMKNKGTFSKVLYFFIIGSFAGWLLECVFKAAARHFERAPGLLYSPFCILYGPSN